MRAGVAWVLVVLSLAGLCIQISRIYGQMSTQSTEAKTTFIDSCMKDDHKYYQCVILFEKGKLPK